MDALIERESTRILTEAEAVAADKSISAPERVIATVLAMNMQENDEGDQMLEHMHKPQNALMHRKVQKVMIEEITPILAGIVQDGIKEGIFHTEWPYESTEMAVVYATVVFDGDGMISMTPDDELMRAKAFMHNFERLLGAEEGCFSSQLHLLF